MVLSKSEIRAAIQKRELDIEPFDESKLTPNGYLLTVERVTVPSVHWTVKTGFVAVGKQTAFQVQTREHIRLGSEMTATMTLSSTYSNKGVLACLPRLDAGYTGKVQIYAFNSSIRTLDVDTGEIIAELVLERVSDAETVPMETVPAVEKPRKSLTAPPLAAVTDSTPLGTRLDPRDGGSPCLNHKCTACCHETEMPLTNEDKERIEGCGFKDFWVENKDWVTLKNVDGKCIFLLQNGKCKVYEDRPTGCRFYPAVWSFDENGPVYDVDCPHGSEFFLTGTLAKDLKNLVDTVQRERKQRRFRKGVL